MYVGRGGLGHAAMEWNGMRRSERKTNANRSNNSLNLANATEPGDPIARLMHFCSVAEPLFTALSRDFSEASSRQTTANYVRFGHDTHLTAPLYARLVFLVH